MTLTVRAATVSGATTKGSELTHAEMDANWEHVIQASNQSFLQSGSAATTQNLQDKIRQFAKTPQDFGAVANSTGSTGSGTDVTTHFQAALDAINAAGGGTLYIPDSGTSWYRLTGTIRGYANTTIMGSRNAKLFFDSTDFGNTGGSASDRTDFKQAAIVFHSADPDLCTKVTSRSYSGVTEIENCWVKGITVKSRGSYTGSFSSTHKGIRLHGCKNSGVVDCRVEGFNGDAIYANEYGVNVTFAHNYITECTHNALNFNGRIYNSRIVHNHAYRVGCLVEATGWDNDIGDNICDTYDTNGIWIAEDTVEFEASANVHDNRLVNGSSLSHHGILVNSSAYDVNIVVANNFVRGSTTNGIRAFCGSTGNGTVHITGNVIVDETTANATHGISIGDFSTRVNVHGNHIFLTTDNLFAAIGIVGTGSLCNVWGNSVHMNGHTLRGSATNFAGIFQHNTSTPSLLFYDNVVDGQVVESPSYTATDQDATPSVQYIRRMTISNTVGTTITDFDDGKDGQQLWCRFSNGNTTIDFTGTNLKGNAGVDWVPAANDTMHCVRSGTIWYCNVSDNSA